MPGRTPGFKWYAERAGFTPLIKKQARASLGKWEGGSTLRPRCFMPIVERDRAFIDGFLESVQEGFRVMTGYVKAYTRGRRHPTRASRSPGRIGS